MLSVGFTNTHDYTVWAHVLIDFDKTSKLIQSTCILHANHLQSGLTQFTFNSNQLNAHSMWTWSIWINVHSICMHYFYYVDRPLKCTATYVCCFYIKHWNGNLNSSNNVILVFSCHCIAYQIWFRKGSSEPCDPPLDPPLHKVMYLCIEFTQYIA